MQLARMLRKQPGWLFSDESEDSAARARLANLENGRLVNVSRAECEALQAVLGGAPGELWRLALQDPRRLDPEVRAYYENTIKELTTGPCSDADELMRFLEGLAARRGLGLSTVTGPLLYLLQDLDRLTPASTDGGRLHPRYTTEPKGPPLDPLWQFMYACRDLANMHSRPEATRAAVAAFSAVAYSMRAGHLREHPDGLEPGKAHVARVTVDLPKPPKPSREED